MELIIQFIALSALAIAFLIALMCAIGGAVTCFDEGKQDLSENLLATTVWVIISGFFGNFFFQVLKYMGVF